MLRSRQDKHLHGVPPHETVLYNELVALFKSEAIQGVLGAKTGGMFAKQMNRLKAVDHCRRSFRERAPVVHPLLR